MSATAKYLLNDIGGRQGWSEHTKRELACDFIDNLELLVPKDKEADFCVIFEKWLENKADWENNHGLEVNNGS